MSKYDALWRHVKSSSEPEVDLSFDAIQQIRGFPIDHSFLNYKKEAEAYGYRVKRTYLKQKRVVFEKIDNGI